MRRSTRFTTRLLGAGVDNHAFRGSKVQRPSGLSYPSAACDKNEGPDRGSLISAMEEADSLRFISKCFEFSRRHHQMSSFQMSSYGEGGLYDHAVAKRQSHEGPLVKLVGG